ncbi:MAG: SDR family oxidoreductase [Geminicoccaceae bacterium]
MKFLVDHQALKYRGSPEDIAEAILFLISDKARFITGQNLPRSTAAGGCTKSLFEKFTRHFMSLAVGRCEEAIGRRCASSADRRRSRCHCQVTRLDLAARRRFVAELARCPGIGPRPASRRRSIASR